MAFPRWLMESEESCHLKESGSIQGWLARSFEQFLKNHHRRDIKVLVADSATSKCRGLIPRLLLYLGALYWHET